MQPGENAPYRVIGAELVVNALRGLKRLADVAGEGNKFLSSAKRIVDRLATGPLEFGEPRFDLQNMQLQVRVGVYGNLTVQYAVDEERRIVYILNFMLYGDHGLS
jgi:hypothetical protein